MRGDSLRPALAWGLGLGLWLAMQTCGHARAQTDDATMLLRICAHESTRFELADCTGIHAVLVNDARGLSFAASARAHSRRFFGGAPGEMNAWTAQLALTCERPRGFRLRWDMVPAGWTVSRQDACLALASHVRVLLSGEPLCDARQWGSPQDAARRRAAGCTWIPVSCGDGARNVFMRALRCP